MSSAAAIAKVVVFGATGNTGLAVVRTALEKDLVVTAFVRNPDLIPPELQERVRIVRGDVQNADDVMDAVRDQDGIVVALGTRNDLGPTTTMSQGTKNILDAMKACQVKCVVSLCISGFLFYDMDRVPARFHEVTADHRRQADLLKASDVDWVAVCPPHISDDPPKGTYDVVEGKMAGRFVSKYDLADLLLKCLSSAQYSHRLIGIGYAPQS